MVVDLALHLGGGVVPYLEMSCEELVYWYRTLGERLR